MNTPFSILRKIRQLVAEAIDGLTLIQLHTIPPGFKNNIAWNVAHIVVTQQLLHYSLSSKSCLVSKDLINLYRKGTVPKSLFTQTTFDEVLTLLRELPNQLEKDYNDGVFTEYNEYMTSTGFVIDSIDSAIHFNNMHEAMHLGIIMAQKKLV
jgi:hypothetical protein